MARRLLRIGLLAGAYFVTARLGLMLDAVAGFATLVWPPTGIALIALFLFGEELWPAVALGALAVNWAVGAPVLVASGIAAGNTLEALLGSRLLRRARFRPALDRLWDVLALVLLAALCSTLVSAVIGVGSLRAGAVIESEKAFAAARAWWIGDMLGDLVVAPLLFVFLAQPSPVRRSWKWVEAAALAALFCLSGLRVFGADREGLFTQPYVFFPLLLWAAWRFGPRGAAASVFFVSALAITGTALGHGPFLRGALSESLLFVQSFVAIAALTALVLGAAIAERDHAVLARDEFLSVASHELSTPLTALSLQVQSQLRSLERDVPPPESLRAQTQSIWRMVRRLGRLINELLDISRISSGRLELDREEFDLAALLREAVARLEEQFARSGCAVTLQASAPVLGRWDRTRLDQVIDNLLTNALKYGAGKPVEVAVEARGALARFEVRDHGIGIESADQARIFERFERAAPDRRFGGFGIGLWIARRVVQAHGGSIQVTSLPGHGSTFTVELPISGIGSEERGGADAGRLDPQ